jgi:hypothetical protein
MLVKLLAIVRREQLLVVHASRGRGRVAPPWRLAESQIAPRRRAVRGPPRRGGAGPSTILPAEKSGSEASWCAIVTPRTGAPQGGVSSLPAYQAGAVPSAKSKLIARPMIAGGHWSVSLLADEVCALRRRAKRQVSAPSGVFQEVLLTSRNGGPIVSYLESLFSLHGKNALVTGAASGLGRRCAVVLAQAGTRVALVDLTRLASPRRRLRSAMRSRAPPSTTPPSPQRGEGAGKGASDPRYCLSACAFSVASSTSLRNVITATLRVR